MVGSGGTIMNTHDGGNSWSIQSISNYEESCYLYDLSFADRNCGCLIDTWKNVWKTSDGGSTWVRIYKDEDDNDIRSVAFRDNTHGFIAGSEGLLLVSDDGGISWQQNGNMPDEYFTKISFITPDSGYILSWQGSIFNTQDGGMTWNLQSSGVWTPLEDLLFINSQLGYVYGQNGVLLKTTNGGDEWNLCFPQDSSLSIYTLCGTGADTLIMIAEKDMGWYMDLRFERSFDGGQSWLEIPYDNDDPWPYVSLYLGDGTCFFAGGHGLMIKTTDCGNSWTYLSTLITPNLISDIDFPTNEVGYASMLNYYYPTTDISVLKTIDGGDSWFVLDSLFESQVFYSVEFINENVGFIGGLNIYMTLDGGQSWTKRYSSDWERVITSIDFPNTALGIAVGQQGLILRTTNMGFTWNAVESGTNFDLLSVDMPDPDTGYAAGGGIFLKTTDGGENWNPVPVSFTDLAEICFLNTRMGYVTCTEDIMKTTDGGLTWQNITPYNVTEYFRHVSFFDSDTGYAGGGRHFTSSVLMKTTNGGINWAKESVPTGYPIECIYVNQANKVFASSHDLYFFGKSNDGMTGISPSLPGLNTMGATCYPNPFCSSTTITYYLSSRAKVKLSVTDVKGDPVCELFEGYQDAGTHEVIFRAGHLKPGVYFYQLLINNENFTGKFVKIK